MTLETLIHSIRAILEYADFAGASHELAAIIDGVATNGATSEAVQTAIDYLITLGELEEYTEPGGAESLIIAPDRRQTIRGEPPSPVLRLAGQAKLLADKRNWSRTELQIQEAMPVPFLHVDPEAYETSKRSMVFPPATADSMWWEARIWQRRTEISFEQIRSGDRLGPLVLPFRITYPEGRDNHDAKLPSRMTASGRVCACYEIAFDYFLRPNTSLVVLVGRLPSEITEIMGVTAIDGIYLWGFIEVITDISVAEQQSFSDVPVSPAQLVENSEARSEQDHDSLNLIATFPSDQTTSDFIQSALERAGITCSMRGSRVVTVEVWNSSKEQAIAILREDSQRYRYRLNWYDG